MATWPNSLFIADHNKIFTSKRRITTWETIMNKWIWITMEIIIWRSQACRGRISWILIRFSRITILRKLQIMGICHHRLRQALIFILRFNRFLNKMSILQICRMSLSMFSTTRRWFLLMLPPRKSTLQPRGPTLLKIIDIYSHNFRYLTQDMDYNEQNTINLDFLWLGFPLSLYMIVTQHFFPEQPQNFTLFPIVEYLTKLPQFFLIFMHAEHPISMQQTSH